MIRTTFILLLSLFISTGVLAGDKCCKKETRSCCSKKVSSCGEKKSSCCEKKVTTSCCEKKSSCGGKRSHCAETRKSCGSYRDNSCSGNTRCNGAPSGHEVCCSNLTMDNECEVDGRFCHRFHELEDIPCWN